MSANLGALVASPHFRWMPGMLVRFTVAGRSVDPSGSYAIRLDCDGWGDVLGKESSRYVVDRSVDGEVITDLRPDLDDPATLGCLLHLVREAWGPDASIYEMHGGAPGGSLVISASYQTQFKAVGGSISERRCAALLAAPPKDGGGS